MNIEDDGIVCIRKELMKKLVLLVVLGLCASFLIGVNAAEPKSAQPGYVTLEANDGNAIFMPEEAAKLSRTLRNMIEGIEPSQKNMLIPLQHLQIDGPMLGVLSAIMTALATDTTIPEEAKVALIKQKISGQKITCEDLIKVIDYLDIERLKDPAANVMAQALHRKHNGDHKQVEKGILSLNLPCEFAGMLAKCWYLHYGNGKNFILPHLNYGFSIEELLAYNKLPEVSGSTLKLSELRINDLSGLKNIPGIGSVYELYLDYNQLTTLASGIFDGLNNLIFLYLNNNRLTNLVPGVFNGLNKLEVLCLYNNRLTNLTPGVFNGLNKLEVLNLCGNQLTGLEPGIFNELHNLAMLYLNNNRLINLEPGVFNGLNNLRWIGNSRLAEAQKEVLRKQLPATVRIKY